MVNSFIMSHVPTIAIVMSHSPFHLPWLTHYSSWAIHHSIRHSHHGRPIQLISCDHKCDLQQYFISPIIYSPLWSARSGREKRSGPNSQTTAPQRYKWVKMYCNDFTGQNDGYGRLDEPQYNYPNLLPTNLSTDFNSQYLASQMECPKMQWPSEITNPSEETPHLIPPHHPLASASTLITPQLALPAPSKPTPSKPAPSRKKRRRLSAPEKMAICAYNKNNPFVTRKQIASRFRKDS